MPENQRYTKLHQESKYLMNITLYTLSNLRSQHALAKIIEEVNATNTTYPGTDLTIKFKIATMNFAPSQEV